MNLCTNAVHAIATRPPLRQLGEATFHRARLAHGALGPGAYVLLQVEDSGRA